MGRPRDRFVWAQVENLDDGRWKCIHCCEVYSGAASRIRDHLSGQGNGISGCTRVPEAIRNEALKRATQKKREREKPSNQPVSKTMRATDENVTEAYSSSPTSDSITSKRGRGISPVSLPLEIPPRWTAKVDHFTPFNKGKEHVTPFDKGKNVTSFKQEGHVAPFEKGKHVTFIKQEEGHVAPFKTQVQVTPLKQEEGHVAPFKNVGEDLLVTEAIMKLLMLNSCSPVTTDFTNDLCISEILTRMEQFGVPSTFLEAGSTTFSTSVISIEQEVSKKMSMIIESWKTTGCALMLFNRKLSSKLKKRMCVFGHYCPKGIVFGEAPHPNIDFEGFKVALTEHRPSLDFETISVILRHDSKCDDRLSQQYHAESLQCFRHEIQGICIDTCMESDWAKSLIDTAVKYHDQICRVRSLREGYYEILEENGNSFKDLDSINSMSAFRLSTFLSFTRLGRSLRSELSKYILRSSLGQDVTEPLEAIYQDSVFWEDGCTLQELVTDVLRVSDRMDTLTPAIGYLKMAIEQVGHRLHSRSKSEDPNLRVGAELITFWEMLDSNVRGSIEGNSRDAASYLNPEYYIQQQCVQDDLQLQGKMKKALIKYIFTDFNRAQELLDLGDRYGGRFVDEDGDWGKFIAEVQCYGHVIKKLLDKHGLQPLRHPLILWEEFGDGLSMLRRCAIRLLSQPVTCMCKQVKKLMLELEGADDYILRLNLRMMHEFKMLGDGIYKPLDFSEWINRSLQGRIPEERAVTIRSSKAPAVQNDASEQSPKGTGPPNKFDMNMERRQGKKDTGRPLNKFAWSHVTMIEGSNKWKCNYCPQEYAGSASRIVVHLSGQGGGISHCQGVPPEVRLEALMYKSNKTRVSTAGKGQVPGSVIVYSRRKKNTKSG